MIFPKMRVRQDISVPDSSIFPSDPLGSPRRGAVRGRRTGRPFGVPGADVELGDIGDTIGGGEEVLGPEGEQGFPGGATFVPPPPFPTQPTPEGPGGGLEKGLAAGRAGLGVANKAADVLQTPVTMPAAPGTAFPISPKGLSLTGDASPGLSTSGFTLGGAQLTPDYQFDLGALSESGLLSGQTTSIPPVTLGGAEVQGFPINPEGLTLSADIDVPNPPAPGSGAMEFGLGDVAGAAGGALTGAAGIAGAIMSDRPDWQKALLSTGSALGAAGVPFVGGITSLAMLGEGLANRNRSIQGDRDLVKSGINAAAGLAPSLATTLGASAATTAGLGALGGVLSAGILTDSIIRMFQRPSVPEGWANMSQYRSQKTGRDLAEQFPALIESAQDPLELLGLSAAGAALSPHGELKFVHNTWGQGGDYLSPANPTLVKNLEQIATTGDPALLKEFLGGIRVVHGETGAPIDDYYLTDLYKRSLVSMLPENHPVRIEATQNPDAVFGATPREYTQAGFLESLPQTDWQTVRDPAMFDYISRLGRNEDLPMRGVSPLFRDPSVNTATDAQRAAAYDYLMTQVPMAPVLNDEGSVITTPITDDYGNVTYERKMQPVFSW